MIVLSYLFVLLTYAVQAQSTDYSVSYSHLSTEDGLSQNFAYSIVQDSEGYIWLGTKEGLNRYDGYRFKIYTPQEYPLQEQHIFKLLEDNYGRLWIMYEKHDRGRKIDILDLSSDTVLPFDSVFHAVDLENEIPFVIEKDNNGNIWVEMTSGTVYELVAPDRLEHLFTNKTHQKTHAYPAGNGDFLFFETDSPEKDLFYFDRDLGQSRLLGSGIEKIVNLQVDNQRYAMLGFAAEDILVYSYEKERPLDKAEPFWLRSFLDTIPQENNLDYHDIKVCFAPEAQLYWIAFNNRLWAVNPAGELVLDLTDELRERVVLRIHQLFLDRNQLLWLGTNDGVIRIKVNEKKFRTYVKDHDPILGIRAMVSLDEETIFFSSEVYSYILDLTSGEFVEMSERSPGYTSISLDSTVWLGHYHLEITQLALNADSELTIVASEQYIPDRSITTYSMWMSPDSTLWLGTNLGLYNFDLEHKIYNHWTDFGPYQELVEAEFFHIIETTGGNWLATSEGLYLRNPSGEILAKYSSTSAAPYNIPNDQISFIYPDPDSLDHLWLGTRNAGLIFLNTRTGQARQWTRDNGLSDNTIYAIFGDEYGHLWMSSNAGIMQFNKRDQSIRTYLLDDGIAHQEFNTGSRLQTTDGQILFGGINGITAFSPADFYQDTLLSYRAPLVLTNCERVQKKQSAPISELVSLKKNGHLTLRPADLYLKIDFSLLDYGGTDEHLYSYRIDGLSEDWQTLNQPSLQLYSLPSGNYHLQIRARNVLNGLSEQQIDLPLRVLAPFYFRTWFVALMFGIIAFVTWSWFRLRLQQSRRIQTQLEVEVQSRTRQILEDKLIIEKQAERLKNLDVMKSRFFANISHELRTPLTLILSPVKALLGKEEIKENQQLNEALSLVNRNSQSLLKLVEEILDLSKLEAGKVGLQEESVFLLQFVKNLIAPFEYKAKQEGLEFKLVTNCDTNLAVLVDSTKLRKIINNLLSNAFKFTSAGKTVQLRLIEESEWILVQIEDEGIGIREQDLPFVFDRYFQSADPKGKNQGGTGIGLALSKEFALLMEGTLSAKSIYGEGSTFSLGFPKQLAKSRPEVPYQRNSLDRSGASTGLIPKKQNSDIGEGKEHIVLLVEDNPELRQFIYKLLAEDIFLVRTARNGKEALQALEADKVDLILSDVMMPIMDGYELLQHVKSRKEWKDIPFIMLTARTALEDRLQALRIGVDDYLSKPFEPQELLLRVTNLINNYHERLVYRSSDAEEPMIEADQESQLLKNFEVTTVRHLQNPMMSVRACWEFSCSKQ